MPVPNLRPIGLAVLAAGMLMLVGVLTVVSPTAAVGIAVVPIGLLALESARLRLLIVVFGAVLILDSSAGLNAPKVLYLAALGLCVLIAWSRAMSPARDGESSALPLAVRQAWILMGAVVAISLPIAVLNHHSVALWLRDVAPYLMLGAAPLIALDASREVTTRDLNIAFVIAGLLVTASTTLQLLSFRSLAVLPVTKLFLSHFFLPFGLFTYACAQALLGSGGRRATIWWGLLATVIFTALIITGTRVGLLLLAAPLAIVVSTGGAAGMVRGFVFALVSVSLVVVLFSVAGSAGIATDKAKERLRTVIAVTGDPRSDGSFADRYAGSQVTWQAFKDAPVFGIGPGHYYQWLNPSGIARQNFTPDASPSTLSKFGLVGLAGLLLFLVMLIRMVKRAPGNVARMALVGLLAIGILYLGLSNPFDDKGLPLSVILLLALAFRAAHDDREPARR